MSTKVLPCREGLGTGTGAFAIAAKHSWRSTIPPGSTFEEHSGDELMANQQNPPPTPVKQASLQDPYLLFGYQVGCNLFPFSLRVSLSGARGSVAGTLLLPFDCTRQ